MKFRAAQVFLGLFLGALLFSLTGCQTEDPENSTVRPWNSRQDWEGGMPVYSTGQHR